MAIQATLTLREFLETFPTDQFYMRGIDEIGVYVWPVNEEILRHAPDDPIFSQRIRVLWNDAGTVAVAAKDVADPYAEPDRAATVYLHQDLVHIG